jgi:hypothetical protein
VTRDLRRARPLAGLLALLVGLTFAAPPAIASGPAPETTPTPRPTLATSAANAVAAMPAAAVARAARAQSAPTVANAGSDQSFFKSGKGAAVLVLLAAGLGYTVYSFSHDRVKSPQKE